MKKNKLFTAINLLGLSMALSISFIISLYVINEKSFNTSHENRKNAYNLVNYYTGSKDKLIGTPFALASTLKDELPEVIAATNTSNEWQIFAKVGDENIRVHAVCTSDDLFKIFTIPFKWGSTTQELLTNPDAIVLSESLAHKIYGDENPVGKEFPARMYNTDKAFTVTGVYRDLPENSSLQAECFVNEKWRINELNNHFRSNNSRTNWYREFWCTWILVDEKCDISQLNESLRQFEIRHLGSKPRSNYLATSLKDVYLHSSDVGNIGQMGKTGDAKNVRLFSFIALMVVLVAIFNYIILSIAVSSSRSKEIGIRKATGASTRILRGQLWGESFLLALVALPFALLITWLCLPAAGRLFNTDLHLMSVNIVRYFLLSLSIVLVVGGVSGIYSAGYLSKIKVISILNSKQNLTIGGFSLRSALVVFQLVIFSAFVTSALVVRAQYSFSMSKDMGYNSENIMMVNIADKQKYDPLMNKLKNNPKVLSAGGTMDALPMRGSGFWTQPCVDNPNQKIRVEGMSVDYNFLETMGIVPVQGRLFSEEFSSDVNARILNKTAVEKLGIKDPVGQKIGNSTIIGVVKDFNVHSLHNDIPALSISMTKRYLRHIAIEYKPGTRDEIINDLEAYWADLMPGRNLSYFDVEDIYTEMYASESNLTKIVSFSALLTAIISALGLLGLTLFDARSKTKEIGVKKVMGSSSREILFDFGKKNTILVLVANILSIPISYLIIGNWLETYAYKTPIHIWFFAISGIVTLLITLITISAQSWKASRQTPVEALRYE